MCESAAMECDEELIKVWRTMIHHEQVAIHGHSLCTATFMHFNIHCNNYYVCCMRVVSLILDFVLPAFTLHQICYSN